MMIGYFDIAVPRTANLERSALDLRRHVALVGVFDQFDSNSDGRISHDEISPRLRTRFEEMDVNQDQQVTFAELAQGWPR
jgi:hypothetical protein